MTLFLVSNASFNTIQNASRPHRLVRVRFRTPTFHLVSFSQVYSKPRLNAFECKVNRFVDCFGFIDWTLSNAKLFLFKTFVVWFINWTLSNAVISYFNSTCSNIKLILFMALVFFYWTFSNDMRFLCLLNIWFIHSIFNLSYLGITISFNQELEYKPCREMGCVANYIFSFFIFFYLFCT